MFSSAGPGVAYTVLSVATFYNWLVVFALAGTLSVVEKSLARAASRTPAAASGARGALKRAR